MSTISIILRSTGETVTTLRANDTLTDILMDILLAKMPAEKYLLEVEYD